MIFTKHDKRKNDIFSNHNTNGNKCNNDSCNNDDDDDDNNNNNNNNNKNNNNLNCLNRNDLLLLVGTNCLA